MVYFHNLMLLKSISCFKMNTQSVHSSCSSNVLDFQYERAGFECWPDYQLSCINLFILIKFGVGRLI
jgi:hypothetical protein